MNDLIKALLRKITYTSLNNRDILRIPFEIRPFVKGLFVPFLNYRSVQIKEDGSGLDIKKGRTTYNIAFNLRSPINGNYMSTGIFFQVISFVNIRARSDHKDESKPYLKVFYEAKKRQYISLDNDPLGICIYNTRCDNFKNEILKTTYRSIFILGDENNEEPVVLTTNLVKLSSIEEMERYLNQRSLYYILSTGRI